MLEAGEVEAEGAIRLGTFLAVTMLMMALEYWRPRRPLSLPRWYRWINNFGMLAINSVVSRLVFPAAAVGVAIWAEQQQFGLFYQVEPIRAALVVPSTNIALFCVLCGITVVLMDAIIWAQHLVFHRVPILWRLHRMHHADQNIDASTGLRFHPIEILLSLLLKAVVVLLLGLPAVGVLLFELLLNACSIFNHSNVKLPLAFDRFLRVLIVTPDMHRVHHSIIARETHSNFGFCLSCWDRLFHTYIAQPEKGHTDMGIGLPVFRRREDQRIDKMLIQPWKAHNDR